MTAPLVTRGDAPLPADGKGSVVTVGTFDGVHLGHRNVIARLVARARETGLRSVLVTFEPHPLEVIEPARAPLRLTTEEEKLAALAELPLDHVAVLPFTPELRALSARAYVEEVLRARYRMRELLIGHDHGFGRGREGNVETLRALGAELGFGVEQVEMVSAPNGGVLSSSAVRTAVAAGDLESAALLLGRPYRMLGRVVRGEQRGRALGFRTINLETPPSRKLLPPEGVYAVRVRTPDGTHGGMMNLGPRPTFGDDRRTFEAHLFDVEGDWYGAPVELQYVRRLRDTRRFENAEALVAQLRRDEQAARDALAEPPRTITAESA